jgi:PadR family transcriptional regulator
MAKQPAMREPTYFVLASLLDGPLHGYAIIKRAGELSGGRVHLATGTLYTALDRLTGDGQVQLVSEETVAGRVRRSCGLTEDGAAALDSGPGAERCAVGALSQDVDCHDMGGRDAAGSRLYHPRRSRGRHAGGFPVGTS